jgi:hypothetical protein
MVRIKHISDILELDNVVWPHIAALGTMHKSDLAVGLHEE